jgi:hypothetical protein
MTKTVVQCMFFFVSLRKLSSTACHPCPPMAAASTAFKSSPSPPLLLPALGSRQRPFPTAPPLFLPPPTAGIGSHGTLFELLHGHGAPCLTNSPAASSPSSFPARPLRWSCVREGDPSMAVSKVDDQPNSFPMDALLHLPTPVVIVQLKGGR